METGNRKWLQRQALLLLISAIAMIVIFEATHLDVTLQLLLYDPALRDFPMHNNRFFSDVLHHGLKTVAYVLGVLTVIFCLIAMRGRISWLPPRHAAMAATGIVLIPVAVSALKHLTNRHCPWNIIEFGGQAPYAGLFAPVTEGIARGACFPAGHAAGGFLWIALSFALAATRPKLARGILFGALALGTVMGGARMLQGAHFLSHTLWTAWCAWAISVALVAVFRIPVTPPASVAGEGKAKNHRHAG